MKKRLLSLLLILLLAILPAGCTGDPELDALLNEAGGVLLDVLEEMPAADAPEADLPEADVPAEQESAVTYGERYTDRDSVAAYLHAYGELPPNYLTKDEAKDLGWVSSEGNLWEVTDQMSIGGDRFMNYEGLLPEEDGRTWYECDIDYAGGKRGAKRICFSNDGLIYYTDDHYESFTCLYGE